MESPKMKDMKISDNIDDLIENGLMYVNENRLANVLSKMDEIETPMSKKLEWNIINSLSEDALEDFYIDVSVKLLERDKKILRKNITEKSKIIVKNKFHI